MATQRPPRGPQNKDSRPGPGRPSGPRPRRAGSSSDQGGPPVDRPRRTPRPRPEGPRLARIESEGDGEGSDGGNDRIQKVLAHAGIGSRRACEELILQGRVSVNGKVVRELGTKVRPKVDSVELDGQKVKAEKLVYIAVNKPKGYVSTTSDPAGRPRVVDLVPEIAERVYTVGRLDESSVGLMLLTNDGELANKLAHPKFGVEKIYRVVVAGHPEREVLDKLVEGVWLAEGKVRAKQVRAVGKRGESTILEMVLAEGKNREVRRMLAKFGHKVMSLTRVAIGPISIQTLKPGHFRFLSPYEVDLLQKVAAGISVPTTHRMPRIPVREGRTSRPATRPAVDQSNGPPSRNLRPSGPRFRGVGDASTTPRPSQRTSGPGGNTSRRSSDGQRPSTGSYRRPQDGDGPPPTSYRRPPEGQRPSNGSYRRPQDGDGPPPTSYRRPPEGQRPSSGSYRRPPEGQRPSTGSYRRPPEGQGSDGAVRRSHGPASVGQGQGQGRPASSNGPRPGPGSAGPRRSGTPHSSSTGASRPPRVEPPARRVIGMASDTVESPTDRANRPTPRRRPPGKPKPMPPRKRSRPGDGTATDE